MAKRPLLSTLKGGAALFLLTLAACAGPSSSLRQSINDRLAAGDYSGATSIIERHKLTSYSKKNMVLYYLDLGAVQHDAGLYKDSDQSLAVAESRMDELYTKSVHKEAGTLLLNDNTVDYAGEHFERALLNVYRALDYLFAGDRENALVEIRKLSRLLQEYLDTTSQRTSYKDDAFAQYLSALLYADAGQPDDARISFEDAARTYKNYASAYGMPAPTIPPPVDGDDQNGELVFLHANGVAPRKESRFLQVAWNDAIAAVNSSGEKNAGQARNAIRAGLLGHAITVAYPVYVQDPYRIASSEIESEGHVVPSILVENLSAIAIKDLTERQALIKTRAIARATIKYVISKALTDQAKKKYGDNSLQALGTQILTSAVSAATEVADTRAWATLPAEFRLARMPLPAGDHSVAVHYRNASGTVILTRTFKVKIHKGERAYLHDRTAL